MTSLPIIYFAVFDFEYEKQEKEEGNITKIEKGEEITKTKKYE